MRPKGRQVHSGSFGLFGHSPWVVGFIWLIRAVRPGSFALFACSPGFIMFIRVCLGVVPGSFGIVCLIRAGSLGSFALVWFIPARHGVVEFIRSLPECRWIYSSSFARAPWVVGFVCVRLVNSAALRGSSGSSCPAPVVDGFIGVHLLH